jgi:Zn-dependent peptidase ImmA (M78 family)/DNA-binding XRE family transcriptional regulator
MSYALISPPVLQWARFRARLDIDSLAYKIPVKSEKVISWEVGTEKPTFIQAQKLAKVLRIPFGYLFLEKPPQDTVLLPDMRTINDKVIGDYSIDLKDVISDVIRKQDWYRDYLKEEGFSELEFTRKYNCNSSVDEIVASITKTLNLKMEDRVNVRTWTDFFKLLVERIEAAGILVMKSGKVGNNTHRILKADEFRGFAICDPIVPVIFVNGADYKAAQIFTLIHELAHVWVGESGVSDIGLRKDNIKISNQCEIKCNEVAAEVLVPSNLIIDQWNKDKNSTENIEILCRLFKVSSIVIARRALDLDLITKSDFFEFYEKQVNRWQNEKDSQESGGSFYKNIAVANSRKFTEAILYSVFSQRTLLREGARLLGLHPSKFEKYAKEVGFI